MKKFLLFFPLAFCSFAFIACQSQMDEMTLLDGGSDISISKSKGYGGLNEDYFVTIHRAEVY